MPRMVLKFGLDVKSALRKMRRETVVANSASAIMCATKLLEKTTLHNLRTAVWLIMIVVAAWHGFEANGNAYSPAAQRTALARIRR